MKYIPVIIVIVIAGIFRNIEKESSVEEKPKGEIRDQIELNKAMNQSRNLFSDSLLVYEETENDFLNKQ